MMKTTFFILLVTPSIFGCGGTLGGNPERQIKHQDNTHGTISFTLTASSVEYAKSVFVTLDSVELTNNDQDWTKLSFDAGREIDLLNLGDQNSILLGQLSDVKVGTYQKMRLNFASQKSARLLEVNGTEYPLLLPKDSNQSVTVPTTLAVTVGSTQSWTLGIDLYRSLEITANTQEKYLFRPLISFKESTTLGTLLGQASSSYVICVYKTGSTPDNDDSCTNAEASTGVKGHKFRFNALAEGTFIVRVFQNKNKIKDYPGIVIKRGETTNLGDVTVNESEDQEDD